MLHLGRLIIVPNSFLIIEFSLYVGALGPIEHMLAITEVNRGRKHSIVIMVWQTYGAGVGGGGSRPTSTINLKAGPKGRAQPFIIPRHDWPRALQPNECTLSNDRLVSATSLSERIFLFFEPQRLIPQVELQSSMYHSQGRG